MGYLGTELDKRIKQEHLAPLHVVQRPRPVRLEELGRKATPESAAETHVQVNGLWVPKQNLRDATLVSLGAQSHPRGLAYELDALTRARLCHVQRPDWVMSGWTAAAQWGLEYFVDDADTSVLAGGVSVVAEASSEIARRRKTRALAQIPTYCVDPEFRDLQVTAPILTLIHCLQSLWNGEHSWKIPAGTGLTDVGVQAIQLVDAMTRIFGIDPLELPAACAHHLDRRRMEVLTSWCDQGGGVAHGDADAADGPEDHAAEGQALHQPAGGACRRISVGSGARGSGRAKSDRRAAGPGVRGTEAGAAVRRVRTPASVGTGQGFPDQCGAGQSRLACGPGDEGTPGQGEGIREGPCRRRRVV